MIFKEQRRRVGIERINGFSDAVFAVAITLLILTVDVPEVSRELADSQLPAALRDMWPQFFGFALSFVIIGLFWVSHHYLFTALRSHDRVLIWLNHLFLMSVVFLPFPTEMMSEYEGSRFATAFYSCSMMACSLMTAALWWYCTFFRDFAEGGIGERRKKDVTLTFLAVAAVFGASLAVLPFSNSAAKWSWLLIWPVSLVIGRVFREAEEEAKGG